jgi:ribosomal protein L22
MMLMGYPVKIDKERMVYGQTTENISLKKGVKLARYVVKVSKRKFTKAIRFLEDLVNERVTVNGKLYTKTAKALLKLFKHVEANARNRGFDVESLYILSLSVNKGPTIYRRRRKHQFGSRMKIAHIKLVVEKR